MTYFLHKPLSHEESATRFVTMDGQDADGYISVSLSNALIKSSTHKTLSYLLGTRPAYYNIKLNGQPFWIRLNLDAFLTVYCLILYVHYDILG